MTAAAAHASATTTPWSVRNLVKGNALREGRTGGAEAGQSSGARPASAAGRGPDLRARFGALGGVGVRLGLRLGLGLAPLGRRLTHVLCLARERDLELAQGVADRPLRLGGQERQQGPRGVDRLL